MTATTSVNLDELARMHSTDECPLDRWDRYLVVPAGATDKKAIPHTRATTIAKAMDDGYGVTDWKVRTTALGFAMDPILYGELCTLIPEEMADLDKHKLDQLCEKANEAAGGGDARRNGNILHAFSEQVDRGRKPRMPPEYQADIDAYRRKLDELEIRIVPELVERQIVVPGQSEPISGRADRFVHFGSSLMAFDLKTGKVGSYSWMAFAIQLAEYSRGRTFYNAKTKTHEPMPEIDQQTGIICHLPAGQAVCDIYFVDLELGWQATQLALAVRAWRKRGKAGELAEAYTSGRVDNVDVRRERLAERVRGMVAAGHGAILINAWPEGVAYFKAVAEGRAAPHTADELDAIALAISTVENRLGMPFAAPDRADR